MKTKTFILLFFYVMIIIIWSCEKDSNEKQEDNFFIAGKIYNEESFCEFSPSLIINEIESGCLRYTGSVNIEVNFDSISDFIFYSNNYYPDFNGECCDCVDSDTLFCDCIPFGTRIKYCSSLDTTIQIACTQYYEAICFKEMDTINLNYYWNSKRLITLRREDYFPSPATYGEWLSNSDNYLVFRIIKQDTIYGWIKMNVKETIEIKGFYLNKTN